MAISASWCVTWLDTKSIECSRAVTLSVSLVIALLVELTCCMMNVNFSFRDASMLGMGAPLLLAEFAGGDSLSR